MDKIKQKIISVVAALSLLVNSFAPVIVSSVYAQEASPSAELTDSSPQPTPTPEPSPIASSEPTPSPQPSPTLPPLWTQTDGGYTTQTLNLGTTYYFPPNNKVSLTFTKLPEGSGTVTVKEIKLTEEQIKETGALSDTAYDITSTMQDGIFEYTLTLPTPTTQNVEVKTSEDGEIFVTLGGVTAQEGILTITGLNHFTVFVVVGEIDSDNNVTEFDESGSDILINEFVYDTTASGDAGEWVELYNRGENEVDLSDWRIKDGNNVDDDIDLSGTIPAGGFVVFENNAWLNNTGDTINLIDNNGDTIDQVGYKSSGSTILNTQDIGIVAAGQSVGRVRDGWTTDDDPNFWDSFPTPTQGDPNNSIVYVDQSFGDDEFGTFNRPFTRIQDGIDAVSEGGTVNVAEGDYEETLAIGQSLTLIGAGRGNSTIVDSDCNGDPTISIDADNVTVKNFTIDNYQCQGSVVWVGDGRSGAIIQDNGLVSGYYGIELRSGSSNIQILDNTISDNEGSGIYSGSSQISNITISGNDIQNNSEAGIYHDQVTGAITVSGNTVLNNSSYGIYFGTVLNATVTIGGEEGDDRNTITNNGSTGIYLSGRGASISNSAVTISGNTISSNEGDGIYADVITDSTFGLTDNTIESNSNNGIYICAQGECVNSTVTIDENEINENNGAGIYLYEILDGSIVTIEENNIQGNGEESLSTGIYINYVYNSTLDISANDILENIGDGIHIVRIEEGIVEPEEGGETLVTISNNNVTENQGYGVYMSEVSNSDVTIGEGNTISNNNNAGIYLNSQVQGVEIRGNIITGNGEVAETTGIVVLSASGNEAHENTISGNGSTGVQNNDGTNDFDANENFWGSDLGPLHETTNPEGQGNSVSDNVLYRPFYTDEGRTTLSTNSIDPDDLASLLDSGSFDIPDGEDSESASQITVNEDLTINVSDSGGTSSVVLSSGTVITNEDGTIDVPDLTFDDISESSLSGLGTGVVVDGALQWGLDNLELSFSQPITLNIFVGTALNGQTLSVVRSTSGAGGWTSDGIVAPATCVVTDGLCTFTATRASFYATTHTSAPVVLAAASATQALSSASGSVPAPTCSDTKPGSAPTLLSATSSGSNQVTLTWSKAKDPVTYYLITYGLSAGSQQYGNPNVGGPDTTLYTVSGLSGGTTYYFKVRAGNGCAPGDFSNELSATAQGGIVSGPAVGFAPGVLGVKTKVEEQKVTATPTSTPQPQTIDIQLEQPKVSGDNLFSRILGFVFSLFKGLFGR